MPFYRLMKKLEKFEWTAEAQKAFDDLKTMLTTPLVLVAPTEGERLLLYIAPTHQVVRIALMVEHDEEKAQKVQRPVYFMSEVMSDSKQRYPHYQKLVYGVHMANRKLAHYFQSHPIWVMSNAPLHDIINNPDATGRVAKWAIELSA